MILIEQILYGGRFQKLSPQAEAEDMTRQLASREGLFCGVSSGGAVTSAIRLSQECENAHIVAIICDRGDRYVSTDIFKPK